VLSFKILRLISFKYWLRHKRQLLSVMLAVTLGMAALVCSCLLIRSMRLSYAQIVTENCGNYDFSIWNITPEIEAELYADERFSDRARIFFAGETIVNEQVLIIGAFENELAVDMMHFRMFSGRMPNNANTGEIAVDLKTFNSLGYAGITGQIIPLEIDGVTKEFEVVGIFEQIFNMGYGDGYKREGDDYSFPVDFAPLFYISTKDADVKETGILLLNTLITDSFTDLHMYRELMNRYNPWSGNQETALGWRAMNRSLIASIIMNDWVREGMGQVNEILQNNEEKKDFFSGVLIPVFGILIIIVSVFSLYSALGAVLTKRTERLRLFRIAGMTKKQSAMILCTEFLVISIVAALLGFLIGCGLYVLIIEWQRVFLGASPIYGFRLEGFYAPYIEAVTNNPYTFPLSVISVCVLVMTAIYAVKIIRLPLLNTERALPKLIKNQSKTTSAIKLLNARTERKNRVMNFCMLTVITLVMLSSSLGYLYTRQETRDWSAEVRLELLSINDADYHASVNVMNLTHGRNTVYHRAGVSVEGYEKLKNDTNVARVEAIARNLSTRLVFDNAVEELQDANMRYTANRSLSDVAFLEREIFNERYDREVLAYLGFPESASIYSAPTVAVNDEIMARLEEYLIHGEINAEKLSSGEEILLVFPHGSELTDFFEIGQTLPLADVVYPEEADSFRGITNWVQPDWAEPSFYTELDGRPFPVYLYNARRVDISTRIGGILMLKEAVLTEFHTTFEGMYGQIYTSLWDITPPFNVITTLAAFENWGLPDRNYTDVSLFLTENPNYLDAEKLWYNVIGPSVEVSSNSVAEIKEEMKRGEAVGMSTFLSIMILLVIIGTAGIINILSARTKLQQKRIALLRAVGAPKKLITRLFIRQNIKYPLVGGIISAVFIWICAKLIDYKHVLLERLYASGEYNRDISQNPWWSRIYIIPLEASEIPLVVATAVIICAVIITLAIFPVLKSFYKSSIIDEIRSD
jgi:ABC-type antimicrobial peptide transport system permease subunit